MKLLRVLAFLLLSASPALAVNCSSFPYILTNGQTADATQVMANLNNLLTCSNNQLAPIASPTFTGTVTFPDGSTWTGSGLNLSGALLNPTFSGMVTGTYTLAGTPTLGATLTATGQTIANGTYTSPTLTTPTMSGTATGTYTLAGTLTIATATVADTLTRPDGGSMAPGGLVLGSATGGAQGAGTINATNVYVNGTALGTTVFSKVSVQAFPSSGTYTPTAGMKYCIVYAWGAGGGSAGGAGNGGTGGTTSLGSLLTAVGGGGGSDTGGGGVGGTGGTLGKINGQAGGTAVTLSTTIDTLGGFGGGSPMMSPPNIPLFNGSAIAGLLPGQGGAGFDDSGSGGGGGGELSYGVFSAATIGASQAVTIGAGGTAGASGGAAGFKGYLYVIELA